MCGIIGVVRPDSRKVELEVIDRMCDELEHRGPDDRGVFIEHNVGLAMRRLSVIDVSSGHQPIFNEAGNLCIVFNGEIYNFKQLREELQARSHQFSTDSDTEVIIHLYEEYGRDCVNHLRGMFAFAIWDKEKKQLFVARDRFGIKPLYYYWDNKTFLFASEIKSILSNPSFSNELDTRAVEQFFTFLFVPKERTLFKGINKLLPGHTLMLEQGRVEIERYYHLPKERFDRSVSEDELLDRFFVVMQEAVNEHLISDVPLGAFLSGGVDSSLIVALMSQVLDRPVNTFAVGYDEQGQSFDERVYAKKVAQLFNTNHRELIVEPQDVVKVLPKILEQLDEPFGDASVIPNYCLSRFAREHVTVSLSGLGGDEVCGGYERYLGAMLEQRYPALGRLLGNRLLQQLVMSIPDSRKGYHLPERLKRLVECAGLPLKERYFKLISKFDSPQRDELFSTDLREELLQSDVGMTYDYYWDDARGLSELSHLLKVDMGMYLVDDLLALSDRTSMANSLEMRVPFLDHKVVEFFAKVPDEMKLRGTTKKYLLKKAAQKLLPRDIIYRKKKGFSVPLSVWFRGVLRPYVEEVLSESSLNKCGIFNVAYIERLKQEHFSGQRNHDEKLFALLSYKVWHEAYF